jgi:hypothetical protein
MQAEGPLGHSPDCSLVCVENTANRGGRAMTWVFTTGACAKRCGNRVLATEADTKRCAHRWTNADDAHLLQAEGSLGHSPDCSLVCVENTANRGGGTCYDLATLDAIADVAKKNG